MSRVSTWNASAAGAQHVDPELLEARVLRKPAHAEEPVSEPQLDLLAAHFQLQARCQRLAGGSGDAAGGSAAKRQRNRPLGSGALAAVGIGPRSGSSGS